MKISEQKREKISEQILSILYSKSPNSMFTSKIANEIARDEEFTKQLLLSLKKKGFVVLIDKNPFGIKYLKRQRWALSDSAFNAYKNLQ
jgi:predicted transcriptional regulator